MISPLSNLGQDDTPLGVITRLFELGEQRARTLLAGAGMNIEMQGRAIDRLSGGQKARLAMLVLRLINPNFYLLDEPTNHLDIDGQEALEDELTANEASCLLVSHDRSFVRSVGNRFWLIDRKRLVEVDGPEEFSRQRERGSKRRLGRDAKAFLPIRRDCSLRITSSHANNSRHEHVLEQHCSLVVGTLRRPRPIVFKDDE